VRIVAYTGDFYMDDPRRPLGGTGYYRIELPLKQLQRRGHELYIVPELQTNNKTGELAGKTFEGDLITGADVIVTQRWMHDTGEMFTKRARAHGQIVIGDVDDHYWALPTDNAAFYGTHPKFNPKVNRDHYKHQLAACTAVTVSTPLLADVCRRFNPEVILLRNAVDPTIWWKQETAKAGTAPRYGWTGGTLWRQRDLQIRAGYVFPFFERHPELDFGHVGMRTDTPPVRELLKLPGHTVVHDWPQCAFPDFPLGVKETGIQVMLVPLDDNSFNYAKSALKGLEATASGMPFIADASPEYKHLGVGWVCRKPRDWPRALEAMLDPATRTDLVKEAQARVACEYIDARWADWEAAYKHLLDKVK
jgi:hypothetical protein